MCCFSRITVKTRCRYGENNITLEYLESLRKQYEKQLVQIQNVFRVNANLVIENVELEVRSILRNFNYFKLKITIL